MTAIAVFSDQDVRGGLGKASGLPAQSLGQFPERHSLLRHAITGRLLQDVAGLALQGAIVCSGAMLQPPDDLVIHRRTWTVPTTHLQNELLTEW